jgi:hypothetical protein
MTPRIRLASWTCPSGNSVDVFFRQEVAGVEHVDLEWDEPPPLRPADEAYYLTVILPGIERAAAAQRDRSVRRVLLICVPADETGAP